MHASVGDRIPVRRKHDVVSARDKEVLEVCGADGSPRMDVAAARHELLDLTHRLVREHEQHLPAGSVIRCVSRCRGELMQMGVRNGLVEAVEALSRRRLMDRIAPAQAISAGSPAR